MTLTNSFGGERQNWGLIAVAERDNTKSDLVVIGAGMAAYGLLRQLVEADGLEHYRVTVIGEEPRPCYDRVNLTDCFGGKTPDDLLLAPPGWYEEHGIELITGARAEAIDREQRAVRLDDDREVSYTQLVMATGSRPFVPPIDGVDLPGVFVYRTIEDIDAIRDFAGRCKSAAVLGGGLLGLEAGKALYDLQLEAHVVEMAAGLMPRQLNAEAATLLKDEVESLGVSVHVLRRTEKIEARGDRRVVQFHGHDPLEVDMVVISAGIRPRDELAKECGLEIGPRGGIVVDSQLRTSDPQVHAIGECVCYDEQLFGLVGPCYDMAAVVADNLIAQANGKRLKSKFTGASKASRLKLMGVDVVTLGTPIGEAAGATLITTQGKSDEGEGYCRSIMVEEGRLVGAIGVGDWPDRERLGGAVAKRRRVREFQIRRFKERGSLWPVVERESVMQWPASSTICSCLNITRGELTDALQAGAADADALAAATGASTVCGSCRDLVCELAGSPGVATSKRKLGGLLIASILAVLIAPLVFFLKPIPLADTVQSSWRQIDFLWQESWARQATGYTLLGITVVGLALSLRKRLSWFKLGEYNFWRGLHGVLGVATLLGFLVHTGMRLGHNFTFGLAVVFLAINLIGGFTGMAASLESRLTGEWGRRLRAWRPRLTQLHIWFFWPIPALIAFHIFSVYYY